MGRLKAVQPRLGTAPSRLRRAPATEGNRSRQRDASQPWRAWYKTARWQKLRTEILKRDSWRCQKTGALLIGKYPAPNSAVIDHKIPHRGDDELFWDRDNLQAVSKQYHDSEKQRLEKSGRY
jgi:5-methylcytosine-specific restriction endonuclease McrA